MPFKRTAWLAGCALAVLVPVGWLVLSRVVTAPWAVQDVAGGEYRVELDGYPPVLHAGEVDDGTVRVGFPDHAPVEAGGDGRGGSPVTIGVVGRGVLEDAGEGLEVVEIPRVILCSSGVIDADVVDEHGFPCRITAPPGTGAFVVTVTVAPTATGDAFETTHELTVAP